jgi:hypothetical protein
MKKVILTLAIAIGLMSFTSVNNTQKTILINSTVEVEKTVDDFGNCRWRFCHYEGNEKICSEWEYGYCFPAILIKV